MLAVRALAQRSSIVRMIAYGRWCNILHFLMGMLLLAFSVIWDQVRYR
jgi:hypothetical protein